MKVKRQKNQIQKLFIFFPKHDKFPAMEFYFRFSLRQWMDNVLEKQKSEYLMMFFMLLALGFSPLGDISGGVCWTKKKEEN